MLLLDLLLTPDARVLCLSLPGPRHPDCLAGTFSAALGPQGVVPTSCSNKTLVVGTVNREGHTFHAAGRSDPTPTLPLPHHLDLDPLYSFSSSATLPLRLLSSCQLPATPSPGLTALDSQNSLWPRSHANIFLQNSNILLQILPKKQVLTSNRVVGNFSFLLHTLLSFFFFLLCHTACRILVPRPGIEPTPPAVKVQRPNH